MTSLYLVGAFAGGAVLAALGTLLWSRQRLARSEVALERLRTELEFEQRSAAERGRLIDGALAQMRETFAALSRDALDRNRAAFLDLAGERLAAQQQAAVGELDKRERAFRELVNPVTESLASVRKQIEEIEKRRAQDYGGLGQQLKAMTVDQERLRAETGNLVKALRKPSVRGQWGEIQLRRVAEMAGMVSRCDFYEQPTVGDGASRQRPDMVVNLPGEKQVVVDAKTPLDAYLDALEAEDESARQLAMARHAQQVRDHIQGLSKRSYWDQFDTSPEFVVMFLPSESVFYAALEQDPTLIERGVEQKVILATPTTLIALLRAVHYGWQQEVLASNAQRISELGRELYERLATMADHLRTLGRRLDGAVESYNATVGSLETRVLVSARRFAELGVTHGKEPAPLAPVDRGARRLQAPELADEADTDDEG